MDRPAEFRACPILADFIAVMLQDLQLSESEDKREARDTGTIYDCPDETFQTCQAYCARFMAECAADIDAIVNPHPGDDGFEYLRKPERMTYDGIGSTLYLASVGHGVTFSDDGNHPALERLSQWARSNRFGEPYIGDDSSVYICG